MDNYVSSLYGVYHMNQLDSNPTIDSSGNGNKGTTTLNHNLASTNPETGFHFISGDSILLSNVETNQAIGFSTYLSIYPGTTKVPLYDIFSGNKFKVYLSLLSGSLYNLNICTSDGSTPFCNQFQLQPLQFNVYQFHA